MGLQRVKIVSDNDSLRTRCFIGENELHNVRGVDFKQTVVKVPQFKFYVFGLPDIDSFGDIQFSFTPETVQQAVVVLRNELSKRGELYDSFLASMRSSIDDNFWNTRETCGNEPDIGQEDFNEAAELMLNRIIGLEDN